MTTYYTRKQYLEDSSVDGKAAHRRYYGQFVTSRTIHSVVSAIGSEKLLASTEFYMNDIPMHLWYALVPRLPGSENFSKAGDYYTNAGGVCLAKEAACQWVEQQNAKRDQT